MSPVVLIDDAQCLDEEDDAYCISLVETSSSSKDSRPTVFSLFDKLIRHDLQFPLVAASTHLPRMHQAQSSGAHTLKSYMLDLEETGSPSAYPLVLHVFK